MSKKKAAVMQKERQNFVYGNEAEGVPGCIARGISEQVANKIYDEMIDFAKYAFNKSHAAAYAVVAYQTAWLKYYYPVEFMAALMTSVIDNSTKVSEYILTCRQMGIDILPPDINESEGMFSVSDGSIRYGLNAIKSIGRPVIENILEERRQNGLYRDLSDFIQRNIGCKVDKRSVENFIKAGAFDCFPANRHQMMMIYGQLMDETSRKKKNEFAGQMSLFDFVSEEEKEAFQVKLPNVEEFKKEDLLAFEKEVLGIYISGHPLEAYEEQWRRVISHVTTDFQAPEEGEALKVTDGERAIIGGMITERTIRSTKAQKMMAILTIEDLVGTVEVVAYPRDYEKYGKLLTVDSKVFIRGRVSVEDDRPSKLILEKIVPFTVKELRIQFDDMQGFLEQEQELYRILMDSEGDDTVRIMVRKENKMKILPASRNVHVSQELLERLYVRFGANNVKVVEKRIENALQMN
jgi:DNA polymerase-3 subunit alpha